MSQAISAAPVAGLPAAKPSILQIKPYQGGKSSSDGAKRIIKLSSNENPMGPSPKALDAYKEAASTLFRYPEGSAQLLREAIADTYNLPADQLICGAGSDELIGLLIHAYAGPGDEVLYSAHGFLMYRIYALSHGATPVSAPEQNLHTDVDALLAAVTDRTKLVFVANPNNPTGSYISADELRRLRNGLPPHVLLVIDAAYSEYVEEADYSNGEELVAQTENTVMLRTFSKIYALSALRLGWGYAPPTIIAVLNRVRSPFNVNTPAMLTGTAAVRDQAYVATARTQNNAELRKVAEALGDMGLTVYPSVCNFVLVKFPADTGKNAADINQFLMSEGIIPREVGNYGLPECLRISIGLPEENDALIAALAKRFG